jgi:hypothetical protein
MLPNRSSRRYGGALESDGRPAGLGLAAAGERRPAGNQPGQREDGQHGGEGDVFGFLAVAQVVHGRPHRPDQEVTEDQDQEHRSQRPRPSTQEDQANHDDHDQGQGLAVAADKCLAQRQHHQPDRGGDQQPPPGQDPTGRGRVRLHELVSRRF